MGQRRIAFRAATFAASVLGIGGCALPDGYSNWADFWGDAAGFCGYLQECGDHKDRDGGRPIANVSNGNGRPSTTEPPTEPTTEPTGESADPPSGE